jgi:adenylate kinase
MTTHHPRNHPVILMTGTPGTGKSTHAQLLASSSSSGTEFVHINVSDLVKEKGFHEEWDEEWKTWVIDEDKVRLFDTCSIEVG